MNEAEKVKAHAEALLAMFRAGLAHTEEHLMELVRKAEDAVNWHKPQANESAG